MKVYVKVSRDGRGWEAVASAPDVFTLRRYGPSQVQAEERALAGSLRRLYEIMEDGQLALRDVFPVTYEVSR